MVAEIANPPVNNPDAFLLGAARDADDAANADAMHALYGSEYLWTPALGWMHWAGTHWERQTDAAVVGAAMETLRRRRLAAVDASARGDKEAEKVVKATAPDKRRIDGCTYLFKALVTVESVKEFDSDPDLLNCQNGVLNLRTGTLAQHCPRQRFTYVLPVEYDPEADMAPWHNFIHQACGGDEEVCHYLQECVGYSLTGYTREEKLFYLYGPPRAGKGTFSETLLALLPSPLAMEVDFNSFTAKRENDSQNFDLAELKPSRLVFASESNRYQSLNPAKIKQVTGGNLTRCAFKHKDMFTYRPQYKVWLVSNHEANGDADDDALWGRIQVFVFPNSHLGAEDTELKASMQRPEVLQGVLRWALEGAVRWYANRRLSPPERVTATTQAHRDAQDYYKQWLGDCCVLSSDAWTPSGELMHSYHEWCEGQNVRPGTPKDLAAALKRFGCAEKRKNTARGFAGVRLFGNGDPVTGDASDGRNGEVDSTRAPLMKNSDPGVTSRHPSPVELPLEQVERLDRWHAGASWRRVKPGPDEACPRCKHVYWVERHVGGAPLYICGQCHPDITPDEEGGPSEQNT